MAAPPAEAPVATAAAAPEATAQPPVQTSEPPAAPAATTETEEPEPTPEEQATWTEGERRLHKALVKEREKAKEARKSLNELKEKLDKLTPPTPNQPNQPQTPAQPVQPPRAIEECNTPQAVERLAIDAIAMDSTMARLHTALQNNNAAGVVQYLKSQGKDKIDNTPIEEVTPEQLSNYVISVQEGARMIQAQAEPRKRYLHEQAVSWGAAQKLIPELVSDPSGARAQKFVAIVQQNPWLKQQGSNWPIIAAKYLIGDERAATPATPAAATVPTPVPQPTPLPVTARPAPAAPRTVHAPAPQPSELDTLRAKLANGTATEAEVDRYGALALGAHAPVPA